MQPKPATSSPSPDPLSRLLDALQAWGDEPVVAPVKAKDGKRPPMEPSRFEGLGWSIAYAVGTFVILWLVTIAYLWAPEAGSGFIYADF